MDNDRELLERAAKAAGVGPLLFWSDEDGFGIPKYEWWNPLTSDDDALRLAVKLGIDPGRCFQIVIDSDINRTGVRNTDRGGKYDSLEEHNADPYAATRHAIVRAAAAIGEGRE